MLESSLLALKEQLKRHEGFRALPYLCTAGKLTIGYGRNIQERGITKAEAAFLLDNDIAQALIDCRRMFGNYDALSERRQIALADMMFNLGYGKLTRFKKMRLALAREDFLAAAAEMRRSKWFAQTGGRAEALCNMMKDG